MLPVRSKSKPFKIIYLVLVLLLLYTPILYTALFSFNESILGGFSGFTLKWYEYVFTDSTIMDAVFVTFPIALLASLFSTVVGTFAAIGFFSMKKGPRMLWGAVNNIPVVNPDIVTGISTMLVFAYVGLGGGYFSLFLAHSAFCIPYVVLSVLPKLQTLNPQYYEAALDLGATPMLAIRRVVLPQIRSGIITGALLAFTMSLDDFAVSYFVTQGSDINTLSTLIYSAAKMGVKPYFNALSVMIFISIFIPMLIINKRTDITELY